MPGGDLPGYVKRRPGADLLRLVGVSPVVFILRSSPPPVIWRCYGPQLPPLPQRDSRRSERSTWFRILSHHRIDPGLAKRSCGRLWSCAHRRFRSRHCRSKHRFHAERLSAWRIFAMDCARGLGRRATHQGNGRLLFRDGHDRGMSRTIYSRV